VIVIHEGPQPVCPSGLAWGGLYRLARPTAPAVGPIVTGLLHGRRYGLAGN
jgi:hypothetical protein